MNHTHKLTTWLGAVLTAITAVYCGQAAALTAEDFTVLARQELTLDREVHILRGTVGVNDAAAPSASCMQFGRDDGAGTGVVLWADALKLERNVTVTEAHYNRLDADASATVLDPHQGVPLPLVDAFPVVPAFSIGTEQRTIARSQAATVQPGSYQSISVDRDAVVNLLPGEYFVGTIAIDRGAELRFTGTTTLWVSQGLSIGRTTRFNVQEPLQDVRIRFRGTASVTIDRDSYLNAFVIAPDATVDVERDTHFRGRLVANRILLDRGITVDLLDLVELVTTPTPAPGIYPDSIQVTLTANAPATIYYTTDGSVPDATSPVYTAPIPVTQDTVIRFFAQDQAGNREEVRTAAYVIDRDAPVITVTGVAEGLFSKIDVTPVVAVTDAHPGTATITLDGNPFTSGTPVTAEGDYALSVVATDQAGNHAEATVHFTIDKTPPAVTVTGVTAGQCSNTDLTPVVTMTDAHLATTTLTLNDAPFVSGTPVTAEGNYTLVADAADQAGNATHVTVGFMIDKALPVITITGVVDGQFSKTDVTPIITVADDHPGTTTITLNGNPFTSGTPVTAEGNYELTAVATDQATNRAETTVHFTIDKTPPVVLITGVTQGLCSKLDVTPVIDITDTNLDSTAITLNNAAFTSGTVVSAEGDYVLAAQARDKAGNEAAATIEFTIDKTAPRIEIAGITDNAYVTADVTPVITVTEAYPGTVSIALNGAPFVSGATIAAEGAYVLDVTATDTAGAVATATVRFTIDKTAPVIAITAPADGFATNAFYVTVSGTITEPNLASLKVAGVPTTAAGGLFSAHVPLPEEGANVLSIVAKDQTRKTTITQLTVIRDSTPPELTVLTPADGATVHGSQVSVTGSVNDPTATVTVDGDPVPATNGQFATEVTLVPTEGANLIVVTATDPLGNKTVKEVRVTADLIAPKLAVISPAPNARTRADQVTVSGTCDDPAATVTVNGAPAAVANGMFTATLGGLVAGQNSLLVIATDAVGNTAQVAQLLVRDTAAPALAVTAPAPGLVTAAASVSVAGTASDTESAVVVTVNGVSATLAGDAFALAVALPTGDGPFDIVVAAKDDVGNLATSTVHVVRDTTPPRLQILQPADQALTNLLTAHIVGSVDEASATVTVNGVRAAIANGRFSADVPLVAGPNTITASAIDVAGNTAPGVSITVRADITAPAAPVFDQAPAYINSDRITLSGQAEPHAAITVTGGLVTVAATADAAGAFSLEVLLEENAANVLTVTVTDQAGNVNAPLLVPIVSDTIRPRVTITAPAPGFVSPVGTVALAGRVTDASPIVRVTVNDEDVTLNADGTFVYVLALENGTHQISVSAEDAAGNILGTPPPAPQPLMQTFNLLGGEPDAGLMSLQGMTLQSESSDGDEPFLVPVDVQADANDTEPPVVSVITPPYDALVASPNLLLTATIVDQTGLAAVTVNGATIDLQACYAGVTLTAPVVADALGVLTIVATDTLAQSVTVIHRVVLDTTPPAPPVINAVLPAARVTGSTVTLRGAAEPGGAVRATGGDATADADVDAAGEFTLVVSLADGANNLAITAADSVGNRSGATALTVVRDTVAPTLTGIVPATGSTALPRDTTVTITMSEAVNRYSVPGAVLFSANATAVTYNLSFTDNDTRIVLTPAARLPDSAVVTITLFTTLADVAGNAYGASATSTFTVIDDTPPAAPVLTPVPNATNQTQLTLTGTAEPNAQITATGGATPAAATADGTGHFTLVVTLVADQANTLAVTATDAAANVSAAATVTVTHDAAAPTVTGVTPADGTADVSVDATVTVSFSEPVAPGAVAGVELRNGANPVLVTRTLSAPNTLTLDPVARLDGSTTYTVVVPVSVTDLAGNALAAATTASFTTVDNVPPPAPVVSGVTPASPTNSPTATVSGYSDPGTTVRITATAPGAQTPIQAEQAIPPAGAGDFALAVGLHANALNTLTIVAVDAHTNVSAAVTRVTQQDSTAPTVTRSIPVDNGTLVQTHGIFVEFSEPMDPADFTGASPMLQLFDSLNQPVAGEVRLSVSGKSVRFQPTVHLTPGADYKFSVAAQASDLAGNTIGGSYLVDFRAVATTAADKPAAPVLDPAPPATTHAAQLTLTGTAEANQVLHILGGQAPVTVTVEPDGAFLAVVPLRTGCLNNLVLYVTRDGVNGLIATAAVTQRGTSSGIQVVSPQPGLTYDNASVTVTGVIHDPQRVSDVRVDGSPAAIFGLYFARQVVYTTAGEKTVTVTATVTDDNGAATTVTETVTFTLALSQTDTQPPIVAILFPAAGAVLRSRFIEVMGTVEEGGQLLSLTVDNVPAHSMIGNIFLVYAELKNQGDNTITVIARDRAGFVGQQSVTVFVDDIVPAAPTVDEFTDDPTEQRIVPVTGAAEPNVGILIQGGLTAVLGYADATGAFSVDVPLNPNAVNQLSIRAVDAVGNLSDTVERSITHDDVPPTVLSIVPADQATGVPVNHQIAITFSEPMNPASIVLGDTLTVSNPDGAVAGNLIFAPDGAKITFVPAAKFQRSDTIAITVDRRVADQNGFQMLVSTAASFRTAEYKTTFSGVIVDPDIRRLEGVRVGILAADQNAAPAVETRTTSFGTFLLDNVPLGKQTLFIDGRDHADQVANDNRRFGYLEFEVVIVRDTDNSFGRPIFLVPADLSTVTPARDAGGTVAFTGVDNGLAGFSITYAAGAARFANGTSVGGISATRILPAFIPSRLPDGAVPHFMVEIGPEDLTFAPGAVMTFPNAYDLALGDLVKVFYFLGGVHTYVELGQYPVGAGGSIVTGPVLPGAGFVGIVPANAELGLDKNYLRGRVVGTDGRGIPNVRVNAVAGDAIAVTDANGEYVITLPDVRLFEIRTYATVPTSLGAAADGSQALVFQSALTELKPSGVTEMPNIVVDSFYLGGSIRYIDVDGNKLPRTGVAFLDGELRAVDDATARGVRIFVYRRIVAEDGSTAGWDSAPYAASNAANDWLQEGYDSSFSLAFTGALNDATAQSATNDTGVPRSGDIVRVVAFDPVTGWYGETDLRIPSLAAVQDQDMAGLDVLADVDLRPPILELDVNRVFYIDGIRRRAAVPNTGIVLTNDEYVEVRTRWRTPETEPLDRAELQLNGRLQVSSIGWQNDIFFTVRGGEHPRILEIREALYPARLEVLQRDTEVGTETFSFSADGGFAGQRLIPVAAIDQAPPAQTFFFNVVELSIEPDGSGAYTAAGRAKPGTQLTIGGQLVTAGSDGRFSVTLGTVPDGGIPVSIGNGETVMIGASYTPVLEAVTPATGSQGDTITLTGQHFSPAPSDNRVAFNGAPAQVLEASETQLKVTVPNAASSGPVTVTVAGRVSNGIYFDFISNGINNGSFETASLHGYAYTGAVSVVKTVERICPTHRLYMALLNTVDSPRDGLATLTTDRFYVPAAQGFLVFDYHFLGTGIFGDVADYIQVQIIQGETVTVATGAIPAGLPQRHEGVISGYSTGSGSLSAAVDLTAYAGTGVPIQIGFVLLGRGPMPASVPGLRPDDDNPMDMTKTQGTALLLDNLRLSGLQQLPAAPDPATLTIQPVDATGVIVSAAAGTVPAESEIYALNLQDGAQFGVEAQPDGSFNVSVSRFAEVDTYYLIVYRQTMVEESTDGRYSPSIVLRIPNQ